MKIGHTTIKICQGDITDQDCEAIVNAANNHFYMGGGVAAAIKNKGGIEIEQDAVDQGPVAVGEAVTTSGYRLKARWVIHAAVMALDFQTNKEKIKKATMAALGEADKKRCGSLAFPALGCGVGKIPYQESARAMLEGLKEYLKGNKSSLKEIILVLFDEAAYRDFKEVFKEMAL